MPQDTTTSSAASWAPNGEFLIDGLGVDGRDCTQNEPGWAEPGTMSALWGRKPRSPPSCQRETRRQQRQRSSAGPSSPTSLIRNLSSSTSDAQRPSRSTDIASCSDLASPHLHPDASSPPLSPPPATSSGAAALAPLSSAWPSPHSPSPSANYSLQPSQCRNCAISVSEGSSRASSECNHCLNCAPPRPAALFAHRRISRNMKRMFGSMSTDSDGKQGVDEEEYGGGLAAISEENTIQENPTIGGTAITVVDIVQGRTCRPISLMDLRTFLAAQRSDSHRAGIYQPASALAKQQSNIMPDLSILGGVLSDPLPSADHDTTLVGSSQDKSLSFPSFGTSLPISAGENMEDDTKAVSAEKESGDELDALEFLTGFYRWQARFFHAHPSASAESDSSNAPLSSGSEKVAMPNACVTVELASDDPLRTEMLRLLDVYFGDVAGIVASKGSGSRERPRRRRRLEWMCEVGLLSEGTIADALSASTWTTHPSALAPLADTIARYLNSHCLPVFFLAKTKNLNHHTGMGRLAVGLVCLSVAVVLTVLMSLKPSPLYGGSGPPQMLSRWYRLCLCPLWVAGTGYCLATWTGVCVWLTLRGNREPDAEEITRRNSIAQESLRGNDAVRSAQELMQTNTQDQAARKRWIAPELEGLLLRIVGRRPAQNAVLPVFTTPPASPASKKLTELAADSNTFPASGSNSFGDTTGPSSPISAPSPITLALASPSLKSRRIPIVPFEVAVIKPAMLASEGNIPEDAFVSWKQGPVKDETVRSSTPAALSRKRDSHSTAMRRAWSRVKQMTGFAVDTEPVLDERVRREQQKEAFKALSICAGLTLVILIISVAVP